VIEVNRRRVQRVRLTRRAEEALDREESEPAEADPDDAKPPD